MSQNSLVKVKLEVVSKIIKAISSMRCVVVQILSHAFIDLHLKVRVTFLRDSNTLKLIVVL